MDRQTDTTDRQMDRWISNHYRLVQRDRWTDQQADFQTYRGSCQSQMGDVLMRCLSEISQDVVSVVPATKGKINPTNKGKGLVNDNNLLVMGPEIDTSLNVFRVAE